MTGPCALCGREETLTRHHLIPRTRHRHKRNKRLFARDLVRQTVGLCPPCHRQVHALFSEKELEEKLRTVETLRGHPALQKFLEWIRKKPAGFRPQTRRTKSF